MAGSGLNHLQELRHRPMVFVEDLERPELDPDDRHHLERALRVRPGSPLTVCDGTGRWLEATFGAVVEPVGEIVAEERQAPRLTIGFSPVKGDRSDLVVQKLTELGIDAIVPLLTERSVVRWDKSRTAKNLDRHRRIAREAAMQSRNPWLPSIQPLTELAAFLAAEPAAVLADPSGSPFQVTPHVSPLSVAIGPEGGFSPEELAQRSCVGLPGRILRTETAAIAAGVLLVSCRQ